ncbi:MAG: hypothetical protein AAB906_04470 [Patescibacteria group bacterium]
MGHSENLEDIIKIQDKADELKTDLADQAVAEAQERIKSKLESVGINTKGISNESLIILDKLTKSGAVADFFPKIILDKAVEEIFKDDPLFNESKLDLKASVDREYIEQPAFNTPEEKQTYITEFLGLHLDTIKDEIIKNPNKYYTEEFFPEEARLENAQDQANI